jgi:hypothetical protein
MLQAREGDFDRYPRRYRVRTVLFTRPRLPQVVLRTPDCLEFGSLSSARLMMKCVHGPVLVWEFRDSRSCELDVETMLYISITSNDSVHHQRRIVPTSLTSQSGSYS